MSKKRRQTGAASPAYPSLDGAERAWLAKALGLAMVGVSLPACVAAHASDNAPVLTAPQNVPRGGSQPLPDFAHRPPPGAVPPSDGRDGGPSKADVDPTRQPPPPGDIAHQQQPLRPMTGVGDEAPQVVPQPPPPRPMPGVPVPQDIPRPPRPPVKPAQTPDAGTKFGLSPGGTK